MTILFVNTSPHHNAQNVVMNQKLLRGQNYETLHFNDYDLHN